MGTSHDAQRFLKEYLDNFIWYHVDEMQTNTMAAWLLNYGRQYKDWTLIEGRMYENLCAVYIRDPKVRMLFEIVFAQFIRNKQGS